MPQIPLDNFGKFGVIKDTLNSALPIGSWTDARNMRFSGMQMEKMLEPTLVTNFTGTGYIEWSQGWSDGQSTYLVVGTRSKLWFLRRSSLTDPGTWSDVSRTSSPYSADGLWDSFRWGDTCIWNNGIDAPQIFNPGTVLFEDLPNWGLISSASDISNFAPPSVDTGASCRILKPYKNFLVAGGITQNGAYQPNQVWWSDATTLSAYSASGVEGGGPPLWDYESPATLSGRSEVGVGAGEITCACTLNESLVIYTDISATLMSAVGGSFVMSFRRLFNKGAAGHRCAVEFNNSNFVLSRDQIYLHDGSQVNLIAKDRVEDEFFRRLGKSGRFGGTDIIDWDLVQVIQNPDRKEISILYNRVGDVHVPGVVESLLPTVDAGGPYTSSIGAPTSINGTVVAGTQPITGTLWTIVSGGTGTFGDATLIDTTFTPTSEGIITLRLTATPAVGSPVSDTAPVNPTWPATWSTTSTCTYTGATANAYSDNHLEKYKGKFAVNPASDEIMLFPRGGYDVVFSSDGGLNWVTKTPVSANTTGYFISHIDYDAVSNGWYVVERNFSTPSNQEFKYSLDDGATWNRSTAGDSNLADYYTLAFTMRDGNIYSHGGANTVNYFTRILDPSGADVDSVSAASAAGSNSSNKWAVGLLGNGTYLVGFWGSSVMFSNSLNPVDGTTVVNSTGGSSSNVAIGTNEALQFVSEVGGLVTLNRVTREATTPYDVTTCDFGAGALLSYATGVWYGNGRFVLTTRTVASPNTLLICMADEDTLQWSPVYTVDVPCGAIYVADPLGSMQRQQLEYWKDNYWLFAYQANISSGFGRTVLTKILLPAGPV